MTLTARGIPTSLAARTEDLEPARGEHRRTCMTVSRLALLGVLVLVAGACGDGRSGVAVIAVPVAARVAPDADPNLAGQAISAFGSDLFSSVRAAANPGDNVAVSPASVAFSLAMLEPGTVGDAQTQLRKLLRISDPVVFHASMNALEQDLESRLPTVFSPGDDPGEITMRIANAAYLQKGYPFEPAYLETVGSNYGPVLNEVDFIVDPDAVAHQINAFVAGATNDRIPHLIADGAIDPLTVLALVNALYMKASWITTFDAAATKDQSFTEFRRRQDDGADDEWHRRFVCRRQRLDRCDQELHRWALGPVHPSRRRSLRRDRHRLGPGLRRVHDQPDERVFIGRAAIPPAVRYRADCSVEGPRSHSAIPARWPARYRQRSATEDRSGHSPDGCGDGRERYRGRRGNGRAR